LALIAEIPVVVCPPSPLCDIQLTDSKVFFILNLNGVFLGFLFAQQCVELGLIVLSVTWQILGTR